MKVYIAAAALLLTLSSCGAQESEPSISSSESVSSESVSSSDSAGSPFTIIYPEQENKFSKEKIDIKDVYLLQKDGNDIIVVEYHFKNCWFDDPASFGQTYFNDMYIDGIETDRYYGDIPNTEANYDTKILSMESANVKAGHIIKDISNAKEFRLILNHYSGQLKIYEITGKISDLRIEKE